MIVGIKPSPARQVFPVLLTGLATLVVLVSFVNNAAAQSSTTDGDNDWHFRYELFQMLLEQGGLEVSSRDDVFASPKDSVIVNLGAMYGALPPTEMERFANRGGVVLMATDQQYFAASFGDIVGGPAEAPEVADRYQGHRDCLKVTNVNSSHPLMQGVNVVVVNRSGWLKAPRLRFRSWNVAARLPDNCSPRISSGQPVLATVDSGGNNEIRMITCADPSLFTNGMMWHGDNAFLAINIAKLLTDGRSKLHFIVDEIPQPTYEASPLVNRTADQTPPSPDELLETRLNGMLRVLNEKLMNRPRNMALPIYRRWIIFALAAVALVFAIWRLTTNGPGLHRNMPSREMKSALALCAENDMQASELGLSASILAREFCTELTDSSDPAVWFRQLSGNASSGKSIVQNTSLQKRLRPVVDIAVNPRNVKFSLRRFEELGRTVIELRALHKQGQLVTAEPVVSG